MKIFSWSFLAIAIACTPAQKTLSQKKSNPITYAKTITQDELKEHLYTYASDEFEGRETGTPGQKKAIQYLKSYYESLGIPAAKSNGDYLQKVPLQKSSVPSGNITINNTSFAIGEAVISFTPAEGEYDQIVYLGYGIEEGTYSDYSKVNVKDKMVLIKAGEPLNENGTYTLSGTTESSTWSNMSDAIGKKAQLAFDKGAKGVLYYDSENYPRYSNYYTFIKNGDNHRMTLQAEANTSLLIVLNPEPAKLVFADIESNHTPQLLNANIQLALKNEGFVDSENVAAMIQGAEKPDEYVVISSHLDHIGVTKDGQINNGADDDGSGSVALLEIAEAFKKAKDRGYGPKRSIIFLHVTGEEKGLLGSKHYTDYEPIKPLEQTVANLNIDMIGRTDPKREGDRNYIYLIGSDKLSTELHNYPKRLTKSTRKLNWIISIMTKTTRIVSTIEVTTTTLPKTTSPSYFTSTVRMKIITSREIHQIK